MRRVIISNAFKKDVKKQKKRGKDLMKMNAVVELLRTQGVLPQKFREHALVGDWVGFRECHIESDWIMIYSIKNDLILLSRTGSHSDLF